MFGVLYKQIQTDQIYYSHVIQNKVINNKTKGYIGKTRKTAKTIKLN